VRAGRVPEALNSVPCCAVARKLETLEPGTRILVGADRVVEVSAELAARFAPGDALVAVEATGELLHIPARERRVAAEADARAAAAFARLRELPEAQIEAFFAGFAERLASEPVWRRIAQANAEDVAQARARGRSTTRLVADEKLRRGMIEGLQAWLRAPSQRGRVLETIERDGWTVELVGAELGVVAFVFEGRPNVLADACGVLRAGNTAVLRIGSDALGTARAITAQALQPALGAAGLPAGALELIDSAEHSAGWALFRDPRVALAVARGSGATVATLGALARQSGIPVSLHGTGGAWLVAAESADAAGLRDAVVRSLDRKVCNTLNVACIVRSRAAELVPVFVEAVRAAAQVRGHSFKLHVVESDAAHVDPGLFTTRTRVRRAQGEREEAQAELLPESELGREWEWEETPELALKIVDSVPHAVELFNRYSPRFIASLLSRDPAEHERFYRAVEAPFVGDHHTRWVDGQRALDRPELGLSNWQHGRLLARGGVLSGDGVFTVRTRTRSKP
jgi:glutamate-5-semialdehyde dehydrogenase